VTTPESPQSQPPQTGADEPAWVEIERFHPLAAVAALILPGAGHALLGEVKRGVLIGTGVLGLFFGGILIGGIDVVDQREDFIWFVGQAMVGPIAFGVDSLYQHRYKAWGPERAYRAGNPGEVRIMGVNPENGRPAPVWITGPPGSMPPSSKSLAKVNEIGTLYATLAGMLNVIAVLDVLFHRRRIATGARA